MTTRALFLLWIVVAVTGYCSEFGNFEEFYDLGLPRVKGAKLLVQQNESEGLPHCLDYAWCLNPGSDGPVRILTANMSILDAEKVAQHPNLWLARRPLAYEHQEWFAAEEERLQGWAKHVADSLACAHGTADIGHLVPLQMVFKAGYLYLTAIHFHELGFTNESSRIISRLFELEQADAVLSEARALLADGRYYSLLSAYSSYNDIREFHEGLDQILDDFGSSWPSHPHALALSKRITTLMGLPRSDAFPHSTGNQFIRCLRNMQMSFITGSECSGFPWRPLVNISDWPGLKGGEWHWENSRQYIDAVISMLEDNRLTSSIIDGDIPHPATGKELARELLRCMSVSLDSSAEGLSDLEFAKQVNQWQNNLYKLSDVEVALSCLKDAPKRIDYSAFNYAIEHGTANDHRLLMEDLLDLDSEFVAYLLGARWFGNQLPISSSISGGLKTAWKAERKKQIDALTIEVVTLIEKGMTLEELVLEVSKGTRPAGSLARLLPTLLPGLRYSAFRTKHGQVLEAFLKGAIAAQDPNVSAMLLEAYGSNSATSSGLRRGRRKLIKECRGLWEQLLSDERLCWRGEYAPTGVVVAVADVAAGLMERCFGHNYWLQGDNTLSLFDMLPQERKLSVLRSRAQKRLAGFEQTFIMPYPNTKWAEEKGEKFNLQVLESDTPHDLLATLSDSQYVAWRIQYGESLPRRHHLRIWKVKEAGLGAEISRFQGRKLSVETVRELRGFLEERRKLGQYCNIELSGGQFGTPIVLSCFTSNGGVSIFPNYSADKKELVIFFPFSVEILEPGAISAVYAQYRGSDRHKIDNLKDVKSSLPDIDSGSFFHRVEGDIGNPNSPEQFFETGMTLSFYAIPKGCIKSSGADSR